MGALKDYIAAAYRAAPGEVSRFVSRSVVLVKVQPRWWKGYRVMSAAEVAVDGKPVAAGNATQPRWKLTPEKVKAQFQSLETALKLQLKLYCVQPEAPEGGDEDADGPLLVGGGTHAVDADGWPRLRAVLATAQAQWSEAADRWCTEDGYAEYHELLKEQLGADDYERAAPLVYAKEVLRRRFGLAVRRLPIQLTEEVAGDAEADAGREAAAAELLELAVRQPRLEAAAAWDDLRGRLVDAAGVPLRHTRTSKKTGATTVVGRQLRGPDLESTRAATAALDRVRRYLDHGLEARQGELLRELPDDAAAARQLARALNADDAAASRLAAILAGAAAAARDEAAMVAGLARALGPAAAPAPDTGGPVETP